MAEDLTLDEKFRRLDAALDKLQQAMETGGGGLNETMDEFLEAAPAYRNDPDYKALMGRGCHRYDFTFIHSKLGMSRAVVPEEDLEIEPVRELRAGIV